MANTELEELTSKMLQKYGTSYKQKVELKNDLVTFSRLVQEQLTQNVIKEIDKMSR